MSSVALLIWRRRCGSSRLFEFLGGLCFLLSSFLVFGLMVMRELYAGAHGCLRASRLAKSWGPTADDLFLKDGLQLYHTQCPISGLEGEDLWRGALVHSFVAASAREVEEE